MYQCKLEVKIQISLPLLEEGSLQTIKMRDHREKNPGNLVTMQARVTLANGQQWRSEMTHTPPVEGGEEKEHTPTATTFALCICLQQKPFVPTLPAAWAASSVGSAWSCSIWDSGRWLLVTTPTHMGQGQLLASPQHGGSGGINSGEHILDVCPRHQNQENHEAKQAYALLGCLAWVWLV